jgi:hypothetical protein
MKHWKRVGTALAALAFSMGAAAQGGADPRHFYVGAGVGQADWRPGCPGTTPVCDDINPSVHVLAGYQLRRYLAGEVAFTNYGKTTGNNVEVKGRGWGASGIAGIPFGQTALAFARLGIYRGVLKGGGTLAGQSEDNYGMTYGVGVQWDFIPRLGVRGEFQRFAGAGGSTIPDSDIDIVSASAIWRFR